jgi:hypothetical protein
MKTARPYIRFDFELAQREGNNVALVLAALIDHYEYFKKSKLLKNNEFYNTKKMLASKVNLKPDAIRKAENRLVELDYIRTRLGEGNMKFYFINLAEVNKSVENDIIAQNVDVAVLNVDVAVQDVDRPRLERVPSPLKADIIAAQSGRNHTKQPTQTTSSNNQPKATITEQPQQIVAEVKSEKMLKFDELFAEFYDSSSLALQV